jgi:hypothetical protein
MCEFSFKIWLETGIENAAFGGYVTALQAIPPNP